MPKKKTHEEFVEEVKLMNPSIEITSQYLTSNKKVNCKCSIDGYEWDITPNQLLKGYGCPICKNRRIRYTSKTLQEKLNSYNKNIDIIGKFINVNTSVKCECRICNYIWNVKPNDLLNGGGCPRCNKCERYTTDTFKDIMFTIDNSIEIMGEYINAFTKIKCRCKTCSHMWYSRPNNLLNEYGCPNCSKSKGEIRIERFITKYNFQFEPQYKCQDLKGVHNGLLSYDFYLPKYNMFIEYQGQFHDGTIKGDLQSETELKIQQEHDRRKSEYAKENNIELLEIWYWDYENIERILSEKLNINSNKELA